VILSAKVLSSIALVTVLALPALASDPEHVEKLRETRSCAKCDLSDAILTGETLNGANLEGANLRGAKLGQATLYRALLRAADLTGADLNGADLSGANLENAIGINLTGAITDFRTICPSGTPGPCL
jgi:uncharacterized protein YjbI with pentapeptide repeats